MFQSSSYRTTIDRTVLTRYRWIEVRNAAAVIAASDPAALRDISDVLRNFTLTVPYLLIPGGSKSAAARDIDEAFRVAGWREGRHSTQSTTILTLQPYKPAGEKKASTQTFSSAGDTHKVDNVKGRIAVEVEWNAKDGNLDRDLAAFRAMYDLGLIDAAVVITRVQAETNHLANELAHQLGKVQYDPKMGKEVERFNTTTTTNLERLEWRLTRGDAGGCPVLGVGIGYPTYAAGQAYKMDGRDSVSPDAAPPDPDAVERVRAQIMASEQDAVDDAE